MNFTMDGHKQLFSAYSKLIWALTEDNRVYTPTAHVEVMNKDVIFLA